MNDSEEVKKHRSRSPNHPSLSLRDAVDKTAELRAKFGTHEVPVHLAHRLWKYKEHGSAGNQCVAALKAYGLIDVKGEGTSRRVLVSSIGDRIIRNAPDRQSLLKQAALSPAVHREVLEHYGGAGLPDDALLRQYLVWDRPEGSRFNEDSVDGFIARLKETLALSGVTNNDIIEPKDGEDGDQPPRVTVGDFVQPRLGSFSQFVSPAKVLGFSEDLAYVFVEGSDEGIPMAQIEIADPPTNGGSESSQARTPPRNPYHSKVQEPPKSAGPFISFPLTADNVVELRLTSRVSKKDFERLKRLIDLSEDSLVEEESK